MRLERMGIWKSGRAKEMRRMGIWKSGRAKEMRRKASQQEFGQLKPPSECYHTNAHCSEVRAVDDSSMLFIDMFNFFMNLSNFFVTVPH